MLRTHCRTVALIVLILNNVIRTQVQLIHVHVVYVHFFCVRFVHVAPVQINVMVHRQDSDMRWPDS